MLFYNHSLSVEICVSFFFVVCRVPVSIRLWPKVHIGGTGETQTHHSTTTQTKCARHFINHKIQQILDEIGAHFFICFVSKFLVRCLSFFLSCMSIILATHCTMVDWWLCIHLIYALNFIVKTKSISHRNWVRSRLPLISFSFVVDFGLSLNLNSCFGQFFPISISLSLSLSFVFSFTLNQTHMHTHPFFLFFRIALGACQMCFNVYFHISSFSISFYQPVDWQLQWVMPLSHS